MAKKKTVPGQSLEVALEPRDELLRAGLGFRLRAREFQILVLAVQGRNNREIAARCGIAVGTVKVHMQSIMRRAGWQSRHESYELADYLGVTAGEKPRLSLAEWRTVVPPMLTLKLHELSPEELLRMAKLMQSALASSPGLRRTDMAAGR